MRLLVTSALLISAAPALASDPVPAAAASSAPAAKKKDKMICKREQISTSLHGSRRICKTAAEWKRMSGDEEDVRSGISTKSN